jgi:hypothetical protein
LRNIPARRVRLCLRVRRAIFVPLERRVLILVLLIVTNL